MLTAPPVPAATMAALALIRPSSEFIVETPGRCCPVGHIIRYPKYPCGTTVTLREYAAAVAGMLQPPSCGMGKSREVPPRIGPPPPYSGRVSTRRHGVGNDTNCRAVCAWAMRDAAMNKSAPVNKKVERVVRMCFLRKPVIFKNWLREA